MTATFSPRLCRTPLAVAVVAAAVSMAAACTQTPAPPPPGASAEAVRAAYDAWEGAWESEDFAATAGAFAADAVVIDPIPPYKFAGTEEINGWVNGAFEKFDSITITSDDVDIRTDGPVAWLVGRFRFEGQSADGSVVDEGYLSMIWRLQEDGSYKAELFHATNLPAPAEAPEEGS